MKKYSLGIDAKNNIINGINKIANTVKVTLGPKGKNIIIDRKFATPLITNDGATIAREFELQDNFENMGAKLIKEVCQKTNEEAGDGTTTAMVLAQKMLNEGVKFVNNGYSPILINKGILKASNIALALIEKNARQIKNEQEIENIATISSQNNEIGKLIAKAYKLLNNSSSNITLQDSKTAKTELLFEEGLSINSGLLSPYLATDINKGIAEYDDCYLLVTDKKINTFNEILPLLEQVVSASKPIVIICDDIENEVLSSIIVNKMRGAFNCSVIKAPLYGEKKLALLEDIACVTGTKVFSSINKDNLKDTKLCELAEIKHIKISKDSTIFISKNQNLDRIEKRKEFIKEQILTANNDYDKEQLEKRLNNLLGGVASILVGAETDIEQREKKMRIEDALSATKSAIEKGIVAGGGTTLFKISKKLSKYNKKLTTEEKIGFDIVCKTLKEPLRQILINASCESQVIMNKIFSSTNFNYGYNALENKYCDMIKSGIIDPAKVSLCALKNATSVVTTMLTTYGLITEE